MPEDIFTWFNPEHILMKGGLILLLFIIFAESGLYFGFFFPGESLLFAAGVYCGTAYLPYSVVELSLYLIIAAICGYSVGFVTGKLFSKWLMKQKDGWLFKKRYVHQALDYYHKNHQAALIIARFLPVFRTFVPIASGMVNITFGRFTLFNISGAVIWISVFVMSGYFLRKAFPQIIDYLEIVIILLVVITAIPVIKTSLKSKKVDKAAPVDIKNEMM